MDRASTADEVHGNTHIEGPVPTETAPRRANGSNDGSRAWRRRWVVFHGTSTARLSFILRDDRLRISGGPFEPAPSGAGGQPSAVINPPATSKFAPGMTVNFTTYRKTTGMFAPGEEIYLHSIQELELAAIKGKTFKVYICTKAADADAAKADPTLEHIQAEELTGNQLRVKTDPDPSDPMSAYVPDAAKSDPKLSLTTERSVAEYWACLAVFTDRYDRPQDESNPVVLALNGERLLELNRPLAEFDHESWGDEQEDVETGILCLEDIDHLSDVLIGVEHVKPERYDQFIKDGREAVWSPAPPLARIELLVMSEIVGRLVDGDITPAGADAVVSALAALRLVMS